MVSVGAPVTVTTIVESNGPLQPVIVYVMVAEPAETPVTTPEEDTVAIPVELLLQAPPGVASDKVVVDPVIMVVVPVIPDGGVVLKIVIGKTPTVVPHGPVYE